MPERAYNAKTHYFRLMAIFVCFSIFLGFNIYDSVETRKHLEETERRSKENNQMLRWMLSTYPSNSEKPNLPKDE